MGNSNLTIGKFLIHIIDGTEDTEKILQLCEELKEKANAQKVWSFLSDHDRQ